MTKEDNAECPECGEKSLQAYWDDWYGWTDGWHFRCTNSGCEAHKFEDTQKIRENNPDITIRRR